MRERINKARELLPNTALYASIRIVVQNAEWRFRRDRGFNRTALLGLIDKGQLSDVLSI